MIRNILEENDNVQPNDRTMEVLHREFPQCFNAEGKFDMVALQELLQDKVDLVKEGSGFNFLGKNYASLLGSMDTTTVLVPDTEHNEKPENKDSQNVYISGDNLDALKHLVKSYSSKVKCIYIDPPYNTGSDGFVYNDKFKFTAEELEEKLSISEEQAQRIFAMTTRGAASHAAWLTFMMPRLQYSKDLLSDDGVIFISIDDNEQANLKLLCDYVFGEENFLASLSRRTKVGGGSAADAFAVEHDYVLAYARNVGEMQGLFIPYDEQYVKRYSLEDSKGKYFWDTMERSCTGTTPYLIEAPDGTMLEGNWFKVEKTFLKEKEEGDIRFLHKEDGSWSVQFKQRMAEGKKIRSILGDNDFKSTQDDLEVYEMDGLFSFPKPIYLINHLLQSIVKDNDICIDFFSGSATTADAVMRMCNNDGVRRRFIMVQLPENLDETLLTATGSQKEQTKRCIDFLEKNNYQHTLDFIGFERIKRAAKKIKEQNPLFAGDLGFKHYTLEEPDENTIDQMLKFEPTQMFGDNLLDKFGKDTVLFTYAMRDGYGLTPEFKEVKFSSYTAYLCGKHLYMLDSEFNVEEDLTDLVDTYNKDHSFPADNVVIFGYSFNFSQTDAIKKNLGAITDRNRINVDIRY